MGAPDEHGHDGDGAAKPRRQRSPGRSPGADGVGTGAAGRRSQRLQVASSTSVRQNTRVKIEEGVVPSEKNPELKRSQTREGQETRASRSPDQPRKSQFDAEHEGAAGSMDPGGR
jgi:hypothetical protein